LRLAVGEVQLTGSGGRGGSAERRRGCGCPERGSRRRRRPKQRDSRRRSECGGGGRRGTEKPCRTRPRGRNHFFLLDSGLQVRERVSRLGSCEAGGTGAGGSHTHTNVGGDVPATGAAAGLAPNAPNPKPPNPPKLAAGVAAARAGIGAAPNAPRELKARGGVAAIAPGVGAGAAVVAGAGAGLRGAACIVQLGSVG
jgi:hypothetical protein